MNLILAIFNVSPVKGRILNIDFKVQVGIFISCHREWIDKLNIFLLFRESGFSFTRLDGSMAQKKRVEAIQCFQSSQAGSPTVMLLSLKAGGIGLNLTAASRVFLMDPVSNGLFIIMS